MEMSYKEKLLNGELRQLIGVIFHIMKMEHIGINLLVGKIDGGRDVKEFKPITGNARLYAQYEIGGEVSHYHSEPTPEPEPEPVPTPTPTPEPIPDHTQVECLTSSGGTNGSYIDSNLTFSNNVQLTFEAKMTKSNWSRPFGYYFGTYNGVLFQTTTSGFSIFFGNGNTSKIYKGD